MTGMSHVFLLQLNHHNGEVEHLAKLEESDPRQEELLDEAVDEVEKRYHGKATLTVHYAKDLYSAGVTEPESVKDWKELRREWNLDL